MCHVLYSAYRRTAKSISRCYRCPKCKHELPPSGVQYRLAWSCYQLSAKLSAKFARSLKVDPSVTQECTDAAILRAAQRYSRLNRPRVKFVTYAHWCAHTAINRWTKPDGGLASQRDLTGDREETTLAAVERTDDYIPIDEREQVDRIRSALSQHDYRELLAYANGRRDPACPKMQAILHRARVAVLSKAKRQ